MVKGFRDFLMRGNVVDLAVAVVIGAAFGAIVAAFSTDFNRRSPSGSASSRTRRRRRTRRSC